MDELIKRTQTVLVYFTGMGGEYICSIKTPNKKKLQEKYGAHMLNSTTIEQQISLSDSSKQFVPVGDKYKLITSDFNAVNRWNSFWFPDNFLSTKAGGLQSLPNEFVSPHQRMVFKTQKEIIDFLYKHNKQPSEFLKELLLDGAWLSTHWHFGVWEDHWRWIDWDNDNWITHWIICSAMKDTSPGFKFYPVDKDYCGDNNEDRKKIKLYREYYRKHFPNNSFNIDRKDGKSVNYSRWAKMNIEALHNTNAYKNNIIDKKVLDEFKSVV